MPVIWLLSLQILSLYCVLWCWHWECKYISQISLSHCISSEVLAASRSHLLLRGLSSTEPLPLASWFQCPKFFLLLPPVLRDGSCFLQLLSLYYLQISFLLFQLFNSSVTTCCTQFLLSEYLLWILSLTDSAWYSHLPGEKNQKWKSVLVLEKRMMIWNSSFGELVQHLTKDVKKNLLQGIENYLQIFGSSILCNCITVAATL